MARPPLPRYRATITLGVEFSAEDLTDAATRLSRLLADLRPHLGKLIRARRVGACELVHVTIGPLSAAPDPIDEPLLERLTATREDLAP